jgi:hypothetical protein
MGCREVTAHRDTLAVVEAAEVEAKRAMARVAARLTLATAALAVLTVRLQPAFRVSSPNPAFLIFLASPVPRRSNGPQRGPRCGTGT